MMNEIKALVALLLRDQEISRLNEPGASNERIGSYLRRWLGRARVIAVAAVVLLGRSEVVGAGEEMGGAKRDYGECVGNKIVNAIPEIMFRCSGGRLDDPASWADLDLKRYKCEKWMKEQTMKAARKQCVEEVDAEGKRQRDQKIADYTKALAIDPNDALAYVNRGDALLGNAEHDRAFADYTKALSISPNYAKAYFHRGVAYWNINEPDLAIADLTKALAINPNDAEVYLSRGVVYGKNGQSDLAIADYTKALAINPNDAETYINRGAAYHDKRQSDLAIADLTKALAINPNHARAYTNRGASYYLSGNPQKACADLKRACELGECENYREVQSKGDCR